MDTLEFEDELKSVRNKLNDLDDLLLKPSKYAIGNIFKENLDEALEKNLFEGFSIFTSDKFIIYFSSLFDVAVIYDKTDRKYLAHKSPN